jgi:hypothetical protein
VRAPSGRAQLVADESTASLDTAWLGDAGYAPPLPIQLVTLSTARSDSTDSFPGDT